MGKLDNEHDSQDNATFMQDDLDTSFEVKESLFDKIKSALTRPRLGPGNNVKTTNMSFNSWSIRSTFRKALEAVSNGMSNMMRKKEPEIKNGFSTVIIGKEEKTKPKDLGVDEKENDQTPRIFAGNIFDSKTTAKVPATPDLLVGNTHMQKSEALKTENLEVDEETLLKDDDRQKTPQTQDKENAKSSLKAEVINTGNKEQEKQTEEDRSI